MWLAKLKRMMDELPEQYLQAKPGNPQALEFIPPGSKPVSRLTEEEKKLDGVCRQLWAAGNLEFKAHMALFGPDESKHPLEACQKHNEQTNVRDEEIQLISAILLRSLRERLGFESEYVVDGHDIYVLCPSDDITEVPGFKDWPEKES